MSSVNSKLKYLPNIFFLQYYYILLTYVICIITNRYIIIQQNSCKLKYVFQIQTILDEIKRFS